MPPSARSTPPGPDDGATARPPSRRRPAAPGPVAAPGLDALGDDALMALCAAGREAALGELLHRHQAAAYRYAFRIFRDHHLAEDMTQELFVKLFRNAARYDPRGHFTTYFYRVLANLCFDLLRKRKRRRKIHGIHLDPVESEGTELEPRLEDADLERGLRREEAADVVHDCLARLPVRVRQTLELREFEGLRYAEIAEVLELSLSEVKVLLHRGRKVLGRELAKTPVGRSFLAGRETLR